METRLSAFANEILSSILGAMARATITTTMKRSRVAAVIMANKIQERLEREVQMVRHEGHPARMESEQAQMILTTYLLLAT